jgi:hypothetical protein
MVAALGDDLPDAVFLAKSLRLPDVLHLHAFLGCNTLGVGANRLLERLSELPRESNIRIPRLSSKVAIASAWQTLGNVPRITTRSKHERTPRILSR